LRLRTFTNPSPLSVTVIVGVVTGFFARVAASKVVLSEPRKGANDELQRLSQVMSRHCEQHGIEVAGALQVVFAVRNDADLGELNHDARLPKSSPPF